VLIIQLEEQSEASDRLAAIERLEASVSELKDCCARLEGEKAELEAESERLRALLSFAEEAAQSNREEIEQLTTELRQVSKSKFAVIVYNMVWNLTHPRIS